MNKSISMAALTFGCVAALSLSAKADTFGPWTPKTAPVGKYDSNIYVTFGAGGFLQNTPKFNYFNMPDGSALFLESADILGGTGGVTLGILLDNRRMSWPGKKPRIEFSFAYGRGSGSTSQSRLIPDSGGTDLHITTIDGTRLLIVNCGGAGATCTSATRLAANYQSVSGALRLKTDIHLARNLYVTPALGFVGGRSSVDYKLNNIITFNAGTTLPNVVNENLKTTRLGGEAAADITWKINRKWTWHGGASFALFRMGTRLVGRDCLQTGVVPAGTVCGTSGTFANTSISKFDHQTGYRVGMNTGVTYNGGWYRVTLVGQGMWDSDVPGVQNPSSTNTAIGATAAPASITYSPQWRYGGFVAVAFPF